MTLGEKVRALRVSQGMTQQELANKMGFTSRAYVNKIEKGRNISQKVIVKLATALGVSPAELLDDIAEEYYRSVDELELHEDLQRVLSRVTDHKYTDEELEQILSYARFIGSK